MEILQIDSRPGALGLYSMRAHPTDALFMSLGSPRMLRRALKGPCTNQSFYRIRSVTKRSGSQPLSASAIYVPCNSQGCSCEIQSAKKVEARHSIKCQIGLIEHAARCTGNLAQQDLCKSSNVSYHDWDTYGEMQTGGLWQHPQGAGCSQLVRVPTARISAWQCIPDLSLTGGFTVTPRGNGIRPGPRPYRPSLASESRFLHTLRRIGHRIRATSLVSNTPAALGVPEERATAPITCVGAYKSL